MCIYNVFKILPKFLKHKLLQRTGSCTFQTNLFHSIQSSTMKAVSIKEHGPPSVLKVNQVAIPVPVNTEVLVKVYAAGINPVDVYIREGAFLNLPPLPRILGKEVAGIVETAGPKVGDRVTCCLPLDGGYAEYVTCDESKVLPLSETLSFSQGASLYVAYFVAYRALVTKCNVQKGELLLVHGASGAVGVAATQIAKARGLKVVGTASTEAGLETAKIAGADFVFNHSEEGYLADAYSITGNKGFDAIVENSADSNLGSDFLMLAQGGRIAIIGTKSPLKPPPHNPKLVEVNPRSLMYTEGRVYGVKLLGVTENEFKVCSNAIIDGIEEGWLRPVIAQEYKLSQAPEAHKRIMSEGAREPQRLVEEAVRTSFLVSVQTRTKHC
ncbi:quinone oxidoreductase-like isoform X2 [Rhodnius prolixus]|uniref:quinone oxidoreductase-like isoform X2 n=1 Tax=Rhodnius prolixus TaxID=13249 RepID=UPI003D18A677